MDKIDMSLDDIIKQNRKENRKLATQKKKAAAGLRQTKRGGVVKGGLQIKGQMKQFRARIGGKKTVGKGVALQKTRGAARLQQQGGAGANRGPARKVGKQRMPVKKTTGAQVVNRYRKQQQQQQQVQQRMQQGKAARQQQFNQRRGIQTIQQGGRQKNVRLNRQNFANTQTNRQQQINRQQTNTQQQQQQHQQQHQQLLSRRQRQKNKRLLQTQPVPRANLARPQRQNNPRLKAQKMRQQKANPQLLTVSINNPRARQNYKPVKINRNKPKAQISGSTLSDRFSQMEQVRNVPKTNQQRGRRNQRGRGQSRGGRTVLLV